MWRCLVCLSVGLVMAATGLAQERALQRDIRSGRIVRVVPESNMVVVRTGNGPAAQEFEYRVAPATKYWGIDRRPLTDGLRYQRFQEGAPIWFTNGTGNQAQVVSELWFYDPAQPVQQTTEDKVVYLQGKIVRVDPETGLVVVRTGAGDAVKEHEYRVDTTTRYWNAEQEPFTDALRHQEFREGNQIWYRVGPGDRNRMLNEIRFGDPTRRPGVRPIKP